MKVQLNFYIQCKTRKQTMNKLTLQLNKAVFFGITVRTSNKDEMNATTAKIPGCIQRFYGEKLYEKIVQTC